MRHNHGAPVRVSTALSLPLRLKTLEHRTSPFLLFLFSTPPCRHWACPTLVRSNSLLLFILFKRQIYHSRNLVFEGLRVKYGEKRRFARRHILFLVILSHFPILKKNICRTYYEAGLRKAWCTFLFLPYYRWAKKL